MKYVIDLSGLAPPVQMAVRIMLDTLTQACPGAVAPMSTGLEALSPPPVFRRPPHGGGPTSYWRPRIVRLLQSYPAGLTLAEIQDKLGSDKTLNNIVWRMTREGLLRRLASQRYAHADGPEGGAVPSTAPT